MSGIRVESDLDRLVGGAQRAERIVRSELLRAMTAMTADAERESKITAPVDLGFYKASIAGSASASGGFVVGKVQAGGGPLPVTYAGYINRGTRRMRARPHVNRAVRQVVADPRHIRAAIQRIVAQIGGR